MQNIYINTEKDYITNAIVQGFDAPQNVVQLPEFIFGTQKELGFYLITNNGGLDPISGNLTDYSYTLALGDPTGKPVSGDLVWKFDGSTVATLAWNASAIAFETALNADPAITTAGGVDIIGNNGGPYKISWRTKGAKGIFTVDDTALTPTAAAHVFTAQIGDSTHYQVEALQIRLTVVGFCNTWTALTDSQSTSNGMSGTLDLSTIEALMLLAGKASAKTTLELQATHITSGHVRTLAQVSVTIRNRLIDPSALKPVNLPRFYTASEMDALISSRAPLAHTHPISDITDLSATLEVIDDELLLKRSTASLRVHNVNESGAVLLPNKRGIVIVGSFIEETAYFYLPNQDCFCEIINDSLRAVEIRNMANTSHVTIQPDYSAIVRNSPNYPEGEPVQYEIGFDETPVKFQASLQDVQTAQQTADDALANAETAQDTADTAQADATSALQLAGLARARTVYVEEDGNDTTGEVGKSWKPVATAQKAFDLVLALTPAPAEDNPVCIVFGMSGTGFGSVSLSMDASYIYLFTHTADKESFDGEGVYFAVDTLNGNGYYIRLIGNNLFGIKNILNANNHVYLQNVFFNSIDMSGEVTCTLYKCKGEMFNNSSNNYISSRTCNVIDSNIASISLCGNPAVSGDTNGGSGGSVYFKNSSAESINTAGGNASGTGIGGNGGSIALYQSNVFQLDSPPGLKTTQGTTNGNFGNITMDIHSQVKLITTDYIGIAIPNSKLSILSKVHRSGLAANTVGAGGIRYDNDSIKRLSISDGANWHALNSTDPRSCFYLQSQMCSESVLTAASISGYYENLYYSKQANTTLLGWEPSANEQRLGVGFMGINESGASTSGGGVIARTHNGAFAFGYQTLVFNAWVKLTRTPTLTTDDFRCQFGILDSMGGSSGVGDAMIFEASGDSSGNWVQKFLRGGSLQTVTPVTTVAIDTNWHKFTVVVSGTGQSASFYIDNVLVATGSTALAMTGRSSGMGFFMRNLTATNGTQARLKIDAYEFSATLNTPLI